MGDVRTVADVSPEIRITIQTTGRLELANVGRFLQRLDTAARRATPSSVRRPRIEIVEIHSGSLVVRIAVASLVVAVGSAVFDAGSFAVAVAEHLKNDQPAARSCRALIEGDNATVIVVAGGGLTETIGSADLAPEEYDVARNLAPARSRRDLEQPTELEVLTGPQTGAIRRFGGQNWVELESHPGLTIRIRDERDQKRENLEADMRYVLDGEAHVGGARQESFFVLRKALRL